MIVTANYVLVATVGNQQFLFSYEEINVLDTLDAFWHEDWPETISGGQDSGEFPIDVYAMENGKAIRKYEFTFNSCIFNHFFDKGWSADSKEPGQRYTLDRFAKDIERRTDDDGHPDAASKTKVC